MSGDLAGGVEEMLAAGRLFEAVGGRNPAFLAWRSQAALALLQLGEQDEARRLVGLGVDELSVGASRVGTVRAWVRELVSCEAQELAARALGCTTAQEVEALMAPVAERLAAVERGDAVVGWPEGS